MAISVTGPEAIGFSKDRILWKFTRDNEGYSDGVNAVNFMSIGSDIIEGTLITVRWGTKEMLLVASDSPGINGNEFPSGISSSGYATSLAAWFQNNYFFNESFIVTSGTKLGNPAVIFTAREAGSSFSFLPTTFPGGQFANEIEGQDKKSQVNHSVLIQVFMDDEEGSGTFENIHTATLPFDQNREAVIDVSEILHPHLSPEIPSYILPLALRCTKSHRKYYIRYASAAGENFSPGQQFNTSQRTVVMGGSSDFLGGPISVIDTFKKSAPNEDRFLTIKNKTRFVRQNEPLFVSWLNLRAFKYNIYAKITVYFTDDSEPFVTNTPNVLNVDQYAKLMFGIGFDQLGLSYFSGSKVVSKYTVQLVDDTSEVSEIITCIIDVSYKPYVRYFSYVNSYGSLETIKTHGKQSAEWKLYSERSEQVIPYEFTPATGEHIEYDRSFESTFQTTSGFLPKHEFGYFLELFNSRVKHRVIQGNPHAIVLNTDKISQGKDGDNLFALSFEYAYARRQDAFSETELDLLTTTDVSSVAPPGVVPAGNITIGTPSTPWTGIIDPYPISGSENPVSSSGVFARLQLKLNAADLLAAFKTQDGVGSGVDSDLWRGYAPDQITVGKASRLAVARTIALTGMIVGSVAFDGSGNVSMETDIDPSIVTMDGLSAGRIGYYDGADLVNSPIYVSSGNVGIGGISTAPLGVINSFPATDTTRRTIFTLYSSEGGGNGAAGLATILRGAATQADRIVEIHTVQSGGTGSGAGGTMALQPYGGSVRIGGSDKALERLHIDGNLRYSGTLKPGGVAGTAGQYLRNNGATDVWDTLTYSDLSAMPTTLEGYGITNAHKQGGNAYGATMIVRTNDNQTLALGANSVNHLFIAPSGKIYTADTVSTDAKFEVRGADMIVNGYRIGRGKTGTETNLFITGGGSGADIISAERIVALGYLAGYKVGRQSDSVYVGYMAGYNAVGDADGVAGWGNVYIGSGAAMDAVLAGNSIAIGNYVQLLDPNGDSQLNIGNWLYGLAGDLSIGGNPVTGKKLKIYGNSEVTGQQYLTVPNGTAPFVVTSSTKVDNLNVSKLEGYGATAFPRKAETATITAEWQFSTLPIIPTVPTAGAHPASKSYVDSLSFVKRGAPVTTVSTSNITLSGLFEVAGHTLLNGERILVAGQTDAKENGVYIASGSAWSRASDANADGNIRGYYHLVTAGSLQGQRWINTNTSTITVGTTNITYGLDFGQETDPTVPAWVKGITELDIAWWDAAVDRTIVGQDSIIGVEVDGLETQISLIARPFLGVSAGAKPIVNAYGLVEQFTSLQISDVVNLDSRLNNLVGQVTVAGQFLNVRNGAGELIYSSNIGTNWNTIENKPDFATFDSRHPRFSGFPYLNIQENEPIDYTINLADYKISYHQLYNLYVVGIINMAKEYGITVTWSGLSVSVAGTTDTVFNPDENPIMVVVSDNNGNQQIVSVPFIVTEEPPLAACASPLTFYTAEGNAIWGVSTTELRLRFDASGVTDLLTQVQTEAGVDIAGQAKTIYPAAQQSPFPPYSLGTNQPLLTFNSPLAPGNYILKITSGNCFSPPQYHPFTVPGTSTPPTEADVTRLVSAAVGATPTLIANVVDGDNGTYMLPASWDVYNDGFGGVAFDAITYAIDENISGFWYALYTDAAKTIHWQSHSFGSSSTKHPWYLFGDNGQTGSSAQIYYSAPNGEQELNREGKFRVVIQARTGGTGGTIVATKSIVFQFNSLFPVTRIVSGTYQKVAGSYVDTTEGEFTVNGVRKRIVNGVEYTVFYFLNERDHANADDTPKPFASGDYPHLAGSVVNIRKLYLRSSFVSTFAQMYARLYEVRDNRSQFLYSVSIELKIV